MKSIKEFFIIWAVLLVLNQIFIFSGCFYPHCIVAALPHTGIIALLIKVFVLTEENKIKSEKSIIPLAKKVTDLDEIVKITAVRALNNQKEFDSFSLIISNFEKAIYSKISMPTKDWLYAINRLKMPFFVPSLIEGLEQFKKDKKMRLMFVDTLKELTKQDFGDSVRKWKRWWNDNQYNRREEWIIDGLMHKNSKIRISSYREAKEFINRFFSYTPELSGRNLKKCISKIKDEYLNNK